MQSVEHQMTLLQSAKRVKRQMTLPGVAPPSLTIGEIVILTEARRDLATWHVAYGSRNACRRALVVLDVLGVSPLTLVESL